MKKIALIMLAALAAVAAGAFPATTAAHGDEPHDVAAAIAAALKNPLHVKAGARLTIVHVQRGCHLWTVGKSDPKAGVKVVLRPGQRLSIVNQDLDTHKLVRLSGPSIALGKPLSMNDRFTLRFSKAGIYKIRTKKVELPGMLEVKTTGPDRILALLVVVR